MSSDADESQPADIPCHLTLDDATISYPGGKSKQIRTQRIARALMRLNKHAAAVQFELADAIRTFSTQQCSVWQDHIYAFLGLTTATIAIDYSVSRIESYTQVLVEGLYGRLQLNDPGSMIEFQASESYFLFALFRALQVLPCNPTVMLLTQRFLEANGVPDPAKQLRFVAEMFEYDGVRENVSKLGFPAAQLRIAFHTRFSRTLLPASGSGNAMTVRELIGWVDEMLAETAARVQQQRAMQESNWLLFRPGKSFATTLVTA